MPTRDVLENANSYNGLTLKLSAQIGKALKH